MNTLTNAKANPPAAATIPVNPEAITELMAKILTANGCTAEEADVVARHLTDATLTGHDSHGVIRIVRYHHWIREGILKGDTTLKTVLDTGSLVQFDGQGGMGQWLARQATLVGIERARRHGSAIIAMRRAGHIGRLGAYAEMACAAGIVSVQFANVAGSNLVAPFGAAERRISTAPVAVGVPHGEGDHFILDFATSSVAEGKALVAAQGGKALPAGTLIDADGRLTGDPEALYGTSVDGPAPDPREGTGALRTMGEHKGSGLALACELLAGALTGNGANGRTEHPFGNGWFAVFLDPERLDDTSTFAGEVADYVAAVRGARPAEGVEAVLIPGDRERATRVEREANGLPLPEPVLTAILEVAEELSLGASRTSLAAG